MAAIMKRITFVVISIILGAVIVWKEQVILVIVGGILGGVALLFAIKDLLYRIKGNPRLYEILLFLAMFSGPPRLRSRDPMASLRGEVDWVVLLHVGIWAVGALRVLKNLLPHLLGKDTLQVYTTEKLGFLFAGTLGLSIFVSPAPLLTAFRVFQVFVMLMFSYYWVRRFGVDVTLRSLLLGYTVIGLAVLVAALIAPELVYVPYSMDKNRLRGDYIANAGAIGAIWLILALSYRGFRTRWIYILLLPIFTWILLASMTRSAYAAFITFLLLVLIRAPKVRTLRILRYALMLAIPIIIVFQDEILHFLIREEHSIYTLSDRTRVWGALFEVVLQESPLLGLGFCTERTVTLQVNPGIGTAHGAVAAVFAGGGVLGITAYSLLLLLMLTMAVKLVIRYPQNPKVFCLLSLLLAVFAIGVVSEETVIASPTGFTFYLLASLLPLTEKEMFKSLMNAKREFSSEPWRRQECVY